MTTQAPWTAGPAGAGGTIDAPGAVGEAGAHGAGRAVGEAGAHGAGRAAGEAGAHGAVGAVGEAGAYGAGRAAGAARSVDAAAPPALPVVLQLHADHAPSVRSWVEGVLGWQVVDGAPHDPVPAVLVLRDHLGPFGVGDTSAPASIAELPAILLLPDGCDAVSAAAAAASLAPAAILGWPNDRDRLSELATELLAAPRLRSGMTARLIVGGSAGGVGTTTVALALGGLRAWSGTRTMVAVRGLGLPWRGVPTAALGGGDLWSAAEAAPGLDRLRIVRLLEHEPVPELLDPAIAAVVLDAGPDPDCDVLVCRPDAAGLSAMEITTAAAVVIVGEGPAPRRTVAAVAAGRGLVRVPWSARVARAGTLGRVPAGLPGAWIDQLRPLIAGHRPEPDPP